MTHQFYAEPTWFHGADIILELIFVVVTVIFALYAMKFYRISKLKSCSLLSTGFLFLSAAYLIKAVTNLWITTTIEGKYVLMYDGFAINWLVMLMVLLLLFGLISLVYMKFKDRSTGLYVLLSVLSLSTLYLSANIVLAFYVLAIIFSAYLSITYFYEYNKNKNKNTAIIASSFLLLTFAFVQYYWSINNMFFYIGAHMAEVVAYVLLIISLRNILKKR